MLHMALSSDPAKITRSRAFSSSAIIGLTGDTAVTSRKIVEAILERGGHYFLFVKANQSELQAELAHTFGYGPLKARQQPRLGN